MELNYQCPICGTPLRYEGLCWKCQSEQNRKKVMEWTIEQIKEKQEALIRNIRRLCDMEDPELTDFWNLFSYRNAITPGDPAGGTGRRGVLPMRDLLSRPGGCAGRLDRCSAKSGVLSECRRTDELPCNAGR